MRPQLIKNISVLFLHCRNYQFKDGMDNNILIKRKIIKYLGIYVQQDMKRTYMETEVNKDI